MRVILIVFAVVSIVNTSNACSDAFPEALNILASGKYRVEGRRVRIG